MVHFAQDLLGQSSCPGLWHFGYKSLETTGLSLLGAEAQPANALVATHLKPKATTVFQHIFSFPPIFCLIFSSPAGDFKRKALCKQKGEPGSSWQRLFGAGFGVRGYEQPPAAVNHGVANAEQRFTPQSQVL